MEVVSFSKSYRPVQAAPRKEPQKSSMANVMAYLYIACASGYRPIAGTSLFDPPIGISQYQAFTIYGVFGGGHVVLGLLLTIIISRVAFAQLPSMRDPNFLDV
jgi:hypothetical protein